MGKFKLNKKHLFYFPVMLLLLFSLNLNTFAATSYSVNIGSADSISCWYNVPDEVTDTTETFKAVDCTTETSFVPYTLDVDGVPYPGTRIVFPNSSVGYMKQFACNAKLNLYTNATYNIKSIFKVGSLTSGTVRCYVTLRFRNVVDGPYSIYLFDRSDLKSGTWYSIDRTFKIPDFAGDTSCIIDIAFSNDDESFVSSAGVFVITDFVVTLDDPILTGTPINTPSTEELENTLNDYYDVMDSLPQVDENELADLMEFDFDSFTDGMSFVREMFERTMNTFGFNAVLVFALTVGLATYIIGRKVG